MAGNVATSRVSAGGAIVAGAFAAPSTLATSALGTVALCATGADGVAGRVSLLCIFFALVCAGTGSSTGSLDGLSNAAPFTIGESSWRKRWKY